MNHTLVMIRAIVTSCGYAESQHISSVLWVAMDEINESREALNFLKDDLLRSYLEAHQYGKPTHYSHGQFQRFIMDACSSNINDCNLIPNDDEAHFWPYENFSCLFEYLHKEVLFISEDFEKIMSMLVTEEEAKRMFDTADLDSGTEPQKAIQIIENPNEIRTVELDYERYLSHD